MATYIKRNLSTDSGANIGCPICLSNFKKMPVQHPNESPSSNHMHLAFCLHHHPGDLAPTNPPFFFTSSQWSCTLLGHLLAGRKAAGGQGGAEAEASEQIVNLKQGRCLTSQEQLLAHPIPCGDWLWKPMLYINSSLVTSCSHVTSSLQSMHLLASWPYS